MDQPNYPKYYSKNALEAMAWMDNYAVQIAIHGPACGLSPSEISDTQADAAHYLKLKREWHQVIENFGQTATDYIDHYAMGSSATAMRRPECPVFTDLGEERPPGTLRRIFGTVNRIKVHENYSDEVVGKALNIVTPTSNRPQRPYPIFTTRLAQGPGHQLVEIEFKICKHGGVYIESRLYNGTWQFLAIDNAKPHIDDRPLQTPNTPEVREYRMRWWDKGEAHGEWSPVQTITVIP